MRKKMLLEEKILVWLFISGLILLILGYQMMHKYYYSKFVEMHLERIDLTNEILDEYIEENGLILNEDKMNKIEAYKESKIIYEKYIVKANLTNSIFIVGINIVFVFILLKVLEFHFIELNNTIRHFMQGDYGYKNRGYKSAGFIGTLCLKLNALGGKIIEDQRKLREEKNNVDYLIASLSHQLKTPISSIKMCNTLLSDDKLTSKEKEEFLDMMNNNVLKLESMTKELITVARVENLLVDLKMDNAIINQTIEKSIYLVKLKAMEKGIDLVYDYSERIENRHNKKMLEESLTNILDNCIKYSNEGSIIHIFQINDTNSIKIYIRDFGCGIEEKNLDKIFDRFYREKRNKTEGTGIGLYLAKKMITEQGGKLMVKSQVDKGTTFIIELPYNNYTNVRDNVI